MTVNGMPVSLPKSYSGSGLSLEKVGLFVSLSSRHGVTLLWDGGTAKYYSLYTFFPTPHLYISFLVLLQGLLLGRSYFSIPQPI